MHKLLLLLLAAVIAACAPGQEHTATPPMDSLVSADWLAAHIDDPDLVVIDATVMIEETGDGGFRAISGRPHFESQHIPGAAFADLKGELAAKDSPYDYAVPEPAVFAAAMSRLGVGDNSRVVLYDANGSAWAARVWWMLRWIGFDNAALLDGGFAAWTEAGHAVSSQPVEPQRRDLTVRLRPQLIVDQETVRAAIGDEDVELIDALPAAHYNGEFSLYSRPGHIPGASNVSVRSLTGESGHYRSTDELRSLFDGDLKGRAITYCGGGIAASSAAFIMTRLGYKDVAVYTNSLQEWTEDPLNPLETN